MSIQRRTFLQVSATSGGALLIGLACGDNSKTPPVVDEPDPTDTPDASVPGPDASVPEVVTTTMTAYVSIGDDDSVTVMVPRQEMGQGVLTSMPLIVAEELEADWSKVRGVHAPADEATPKPQNPKTPKPLRVIIKLFR